MSVIRKLIRGFVESFCLLAILPMVAFIVVAKGLSRLIEWAVGEEDYYSD